MSVLCEYTIATYFTYCCIFCIFQQSAHKLAFSMAILILFVFLLPVSIRFCYLDHPVANNGTIHVSEPLWNKRGSWFQVILYHISAYFMDQIVTITVNCNSSSVLCYMMGCLIMVPKCLLRYMTKCHRIILIL